jgi:hypothetical protein
MPVTSLWAETGHLDSVNGTNTKNGHPNLVVITYTER